MSEDEIAALRERIEKMTRAELLLLDSICMALQDWQSKTYLRGHVKANRVAGLAAADACAAWESVVWNRD